MFRQPSTEPVIETTLAQVKVASAECQKRYDSLRTLQAQRRRIDLQITATQQAVSLASQDRDRAKRALAAVLGGDSEGTMAEMKGLKASFDDAEFALMERRDERTITRDAEKAIAAKIAEADKSYLEAIRAVQDLVRQCFKTTWSRSRLFASNAEHEYDWRRGTLESIVLRLSMGDLQENLALLEMFLQGGKFMVRVKRAFWYGKTSDDRRALQREEQLAVPNALPHRTAFEELLGGRLQLAEV